VEGGNPVELNTGSARFNNNDHGISFDGKWLDISNMPPEKVPFTCLRAACQRGEPNLLPKYGPSYWHGWAPDGKSVVFVGERNGEFDIYSIPVSGGKKPGLPQPWLDDALNNPRWKVYLVQFQPNGYNAIVPNET
jgi:Tol biopolymer transport system component